MDYHIGFWMGAICTVISLRILRLGFNKPKVTPPVDLSQQDGWLTIKEFLCLRDAMYAVRMNKDHVYRAASDFFTNPDNIALVIEQLRKLLNHKSVPDNIEFWDDIKNNAHDKK
jgi:hypothetical protein